MIVVVLGMHKSGTTLVSQILHGSGIHMGDFDESVAYDQGGWFENEDFIALNRRLLSPHLVPTIGIRLQRMWRGKADDVLAANRDSVAVLRSLPRSLPAGLEAEMRALIASRQAAHEDWGFKDPRTCLTYPLWARLLPEHRVVAVFRSYSDFVRRNRKGRNALNPPRWWRALRSWTDYNDAMAESLERCSQPKLVIRYDDLMSGDDTLARLSSFLGRPLVDARRPELHRVRTEAVGRLEAWMAPTLPRDPRRVWERLLRLAEESGRHQGV